MAEQSRRAALEAAFEAAGEETTEEEAAPVEAEEAAPVEEEAPAEEAPVEEEKVEAKDGRDEKGRFAPTEKVEAKAKPVAQAKVAPKAAPAVAAAPVAPVEPVEAPPPSWTPAEREIWKDLPPAARAAVLRVNRETTKVLNENAGLRKQHGEVSQRYQQEAGFRQRVDSFVSPFAGIFAAEGVDPMQGMANVVQTYGALHLGSREQKASIIAGLLSRFTSVEDVNQILSGQVQPTAAPTYRAPAPQQKPQDVNALVDQAIAQRLEVAQVERHKRDFDTFQATNPEFLADVWDDMETIVRVAEDRGRNITFQQAYDMACKTDSRVQGVLQQRAAAKAATQPSAKAPTARARTAAATVRTRPAGSVTESPASDDRRAMLEKAAAAAGW